MAQGIQTADDGLTCGHSYGQHRVDDVHIGYAGRVLEAELQATLGIRNDRAARCFCTCAGGGGNDHELHRACIGGLHFGAQHTVIVQVFDFLRDGRDQVCRLCGVDAAAAADGQCAVALFTLEQFSGFNAAVIGRLRLHTVIHHIIDLCIFQGLKDGVNQTNGQNALIRHDHALGNAQCLQTLARLLCRTTAEHQLRHFQIFIRSHRNEPPLLFVC